MAHPAPRPLLMFSVFSVSRWRRFSASSASSALSPFRIRLMLFLCALCVSVVSLAGEAHAASRARPDAALYQEAKAGMSSLLASRRRAAQRGEWEKAILRFRKLVARYPQSGYADDALLAIGNGYREMDRRFRDRRYRADAARAYRAIASEYPRSRHGGPALFQAFTLARLDGNREGMTETAREYLDAYPTGPRAVEIRNELRRKAPVQEASLPKPPPPGLARVFNVRTWSGEASTRVAIDLERKVTLRQDRIQDPDRIWIDLVGARLHRGLTDSMFPVGDGLLKQIRIAQNREDVVRVVLDLGRVQDHSAFYLENPPRLVIDVRGEPRPRVASAAPLSVPGDVAPPAWDGPGDPPDVARSGRAPGPGPAPTPTPTPLPPSMASKGWVQPWRNRPPAISLPEPASPPSPPPLSETPTVADSLPPSTPPSPQPVSRTAAGTPSPGPPQANRAGSYSLARQLGLTARTIVIDAGHGGHDPGSIGRAGLQEKELVLDVALRLERLLRTRLGAQVVMTRSTDVFVALEERTAIANTKGADLFLSIHANSSRSSRSRGIETYFLNFARDRHAEAVAARENAISEATLRDLQGLVKAIALNSKIDESRDFAASVQEAMVRGIKPAYPDVLDRGVHSAPFYVLIGANMPSVLAEISFLSNPTEEKLLKRSEHRDRIAQSLFAGLRAYLEALNRGPLRQLTGRAATPTVVSRARR